MLAAMAAGHESKHSRHCHHCGRPVYDTSHTRSSYRVDYYALHTGDVEPVQLQHDDGETVTILRLLKPYELFTCVDCYGKPAVRAERDRLFRPELSAAESAVSEQS